MPMYEYQCAQCGRRTEKRQKFSDAPLTECPYCGGVLTKVISAPAVQFKGGGWYADGYGSKKPTASGSGEGSASSIAKGEASACGSPGGDGGSSSADAAKTTATASSDSSSGSTTSGAASSGASSSASAAEK